MNLYKLTFVLAVFILTASFIQQKGYCQESEPNVIAQSFYSSEDEDNQSALDVRRYLETIEALKNAPLEERIKRWEQFLQDYPDTAFKDDIKKEIVDSNSILRAKQEDEISKEVEEKQRYDAFKDEIAALPIDQKIERYEDFINENRESSVHDQAVSDLSALKESQDVAKPVTPTGAGTSTGINQPIKDENALTSNLKYKDPEHALFMAAVPGLIVPGMGSFYAGDNATGVILVVLRIAGLGMMGAGIARESNSLLITGGIAAGFSWVVDMVAAPIIAKEHNKKLEKANPSTVMPFLSIHDNKPVVGLSYTF